MDIQEFPVERRPLGGAIEGHFDEIVFGIEVVLSDDDLTEHLEQFLRAGARSILEMRFADERTRSYLSCLGAVVRQGSTPDLDAALRRAELETIEAIAIYATTALEQFGLKMRPGLTPIDIGSAATRACVGVMLTSGGDTTDEDVARLSLSLMGIVAMSTVPDQTKPASAQPTQMGLRKKG